MDQLIKMIVDKVGVDEATAAKVADFIKDHAADIPKLLGGGDIMGQAQNLLGGFMGGGKSDE